MSILTLNATRVEAVAPTSMLTRALNAYDTFAFNFTVAESLKFKRSLALPNCAEMFLQYSDEEKMMYIREVLYE